MVSPFCVAIRAVTTDMASRSGCSDGVARGDLSPRPPFLRGKGERMAFLKVCIHGCFDGFGRMDNAMNPKKPIAYSPRTTAHSSPFLAGTGVAYNERSE